MPLAGELAPRLVVCGLSCATLVRRGAEAPWLAKRTSTESEVAENAARRAAAGGRLADGPSPRSPLQSTVQMEGSALALQPIAPRDSWLHPKR